MGRPKKQKVKVKCLSCKKIFEVRPYIALNRKFCNHKCQAKGKFNPNYGKHPVAWNKGIPHSEESKRKMSIAAMGRKGLCGSKNGNWKGGVWIQNGYRYITVNSKAVKEHRFVWEKHKGKITDEYIVHHINGNKLDNRIENLKMMTQSEHMTLHKKGNTNWLGKKHSEETKRKMSKSRKNRKYNTKDKITSN